MKRLVAYDHDKTLMDVPEPDSGKIIWKEKTGKEYPHKGWWGRKESLNTEMFNIKPYPSVLSRLKKDMSDPDAHVIILTSRLFKLKPEIENVLKINNIQVDEIVTKKGNEDKGDILLKYVQKNPDIEQIDVYDDFADKNEHKIAEFTKIKNQLPNNIKYNIFYVDHGNISLLKENNRILDIINEEISKLIQYIYHGTSEGAAYHMLKDGKMKINAVNNNEPFISFTSNIEVANYYAKMKGGSNRGVILRTKLTDDFTLSPKFKDNKGHEWITNKEIPINKLEIKINDGWVGLNDYNFIKK